MNHFEFAEVVAGLEAGDFTKDGRPKINALNAALTAAGHQPMSSGARDNLMAEWQAAADAGDLPAEDPLAPLEDMPTGFVTLTLDRSDANPLPVHVLGVGRFALRVGETYTLPETVLDALNNAGGVFYTLKKDS